MPEVTITGWATRDVRFPTSLDKTGSDAMNAAGDYSSAYCILQTDSEFSGHGMVSYPMMWILPSTAKVAVDMDMPPIHPFPWHSYILQIIFGVQFD